MSNDFPLYTTDYISGVMSLRKPQSQSLKILEEITNAVQLRKGMNLKAALGAVHAMYPICSDFERDFMSLTFALATGVGKTRLMGAFIAYLYTQHHIRNFFVVAPNTTIFEKLKKDLSDNNSAKYVFKGLGCFSTLPQIITDDDYREKTLSLFESDVHIFVYNIDKFNKEGANMKKVNELIGDSFYQALSDLPDLVLIMDESHHYRAEKGAQALNELHPLLGLELTATPLVTKGNKQVPFKNVVYEYPLSKAIEDGYTRTPYAVTRSDIDFYNFGNEQLDKMMLLDGITCHESTKRKLEVYAANHGKPVVKPFTSPIDILNKDDFERELEELGSLRAKADAITSKLTRSISEKYQENPAYYDSFSKRIKDALEQYKEKVISEAEYLAKMRTIMEDYHAGKSTVTYPESIKNNVHAQAFYGVLSAVFDEAKEAEVSPDFVAEIAEEITKIVANHSQVDWTNNKTIHDRISQDIDDLFYDYEKERGLKLSFDTIDKIIENVKTVALRRF